MKIIYNDLPKHPAKRYKPRDTSEVDTIVVHHSATNPRPTNGDYMAHIVAIAKYHINIGDPGIAYHYVIDPDGETYKTNPVGSLTWHARGGNRTGIGICLIGNFMMDGPSDKQLRALRTLVADIRRAMPGVTKVIGHRQVKGSSTACPGDAFPMDALKTMEA